MMQETTRKMDLAGLIWVWILCEFNEVEVKKVIYSILFVLLSKLRIECITCR